MKKIKNFNLLEKKTHSTVFAHTYEGLLCWVNEKLGNGRNDILQMSPRTFAEMLLFKVL